MATKKLNISIDGATNAVATVAPNKFNKIGQIAIIFDDGSPGRLVAENLFNGFSYSDGCGNQIRYSLSLLLNTDSAVNLGQNGLNSLLAKRGDIENHGYSHGSLPADEDLNKLHDYVLDTYGYKIGSVQPPANYPGFAHAAYLRGYNCVISGNDTTFDEFQSVRVHRKWPSLATPYQFLAIVRDFTDEWDIPSQVDFLKGECLAISTGARDFEFIGTHSGLETPQKLAGFTELCNYINTILGDTVSVSTVREITDYKRMQVMPLAQSFSNGVLTVEIDVQDPNQTLRWSDISLNIDTTGTITGVIGEGFDSTSFNPTTKLVNGFKERLVFSEVVTPILNTKVTRRYTLSQVSPPDPSDIEAFFIPTDKENELFNNIYYLGNSYKIGTSTKINNGEAIGTILDVKGSKPLIYRGTNNPTIQTVKLKNSLFAEFLNQPDTYWISEDFNPVQVPFEIHDVMMDFEGQGYEGQDGGGGLREYIGTTDAFNIRLVNSSYGVLNPPYMTPIHRLVYRRRVTVEENGVRKTKFYVNNIYKGEVIHQDGDQIPNSYAKVANGLGVNTNSDEFQSMMKGIVYRQLTDTEATDLYNSISSKVSAQGYTLGEYAVNVSVRGCTWTKSGGVITPTATVTVNNLKGKVLKPFSEWKFRWFYFRESQGLGIQTEFASTYTLPEGVNYPNNSDTGLKFCVQVGYTDGTYSEEVFFSSFKLVNV